MFHHFLYRMTHLAVAASPPPTKSHALGVHPSIAGMWLLWNALTLEFYTSRRSTLDGSRTHKILSLNQAPMPIRLQGQKKCGFSTYLNKKTAKLIHFCFPVSATSSFYATSHIKLQNRQVSIETYTCSKPKRNRTAKTLLSSRSCFPFSHWRISTG